MTNIDFKIVNLLALKYVIENRYEDYIIENGKIIIRKYDDYFEEYLIQDFQKRINL